MKIDRSKLKKNSSEAPGDCGWLIEKLHTCSDEELLPVLKSIDSWSYGKCELHHWVNVLDRFDSILENATKKEENQWVLPCDVNEYAHNQELVVWVLYFTTLLVEHSFSRHLYSSVEHLITLLSSSSMTIILSVLNLLYMFSKRSNYITRLAAGPRQALLSRLIYLAESWGGKENGFGLAQCCQNLPLSSYPDGATTLHFEFYREQKNQDITLSPISSKSSSSNSSPHTIHINNIQSINNKTPAQIMDELVDYFKIPVDKQMVLFTHLRLAHSFAKYETRLQCVQARLQAISILVYCNALQDNAYTVLYSGLLEEFVDVLELKDTNLTEIKAATLRTLTSIIHLERYPNFPKLTTIIDVTGASSYHGFLPVLVRSCISTLTSSAPIEPNPFPAPLATSLFSFLYHLASYEAGGEALVSCGMMESLLSVVSWVGTEPDHITFVTRAVRVIDLITNLDMNAFQNHGGLNTFIKRLELEVNECRKEQPFVIQLPAPLGAESSASTSAAVGAPSTESTSQGNVSEMLAVEVEARDTSLSPMDVTESTADNSAEPSSIAAEVNPEASSTSIDNITTELDMPSTSKVPDYSQAKTSQTCLPQRAALLKSMLNFLKKDIQDPGFSESMRHLMESSLPSSLKHIISNAEYYGPSLFLLATDVVTVYVFGEPSLLSSLQDNGLTDVVLHALLVKDVPATREVLASLPNVFSALCLNSRGLQAFVACKPFERLFKVLLSPDYLPAMRRRKSSDPMGDTASNLGNAMDELMRHQPSLKAQAMIAIVKLLEEVCLLGSDTHYVCWKTPPKPETTLLPTSRTTNDNSSDEDDDEEEERETGGTSSATLGNQDSTAEEAPSGDKRPVPLVDYVLNVMKFVDAILSNNSTDDHCKEFVTQKGLIPLLGILGLPNLPIDFPVSQACQAVASVCKSILNLAHESGVLEQGLQCLHEKLEALAPLHEPLPSPGGSVLLRELASSSNPGEATNSPQSTPLLHTLSAIHAYIMMLVHVCRTGQTDIRQVSIKQWGTELGLKVLSGLTKLYTSLVWESTVLLALCSDDVLPVGCLFGKEDTAKLIPTENKVEDLSRETPMETSEQEGMQLSIDNTNGVATLTDTGKTCTNSHQMKMIKPLLSSASRLGKALAELFGLLVKLCVGSPLRQRRGQQVTTPLPPPSAAAIAVANALSNVLHSGLSWVPPTTSPYPKFRLTFLICSVRFTNPMLFDDKKFPYHLMLQHFVKSHGLKAFFDIFNWAITTDEDTKELESKMDVGEEKNLPEGTGEFLDTWLFLLEKLVNPKTMIESPHSLPSKLSFCPLKFLIQIHKLAFEAVMKLWNKKPLKNYGVKISESVLVILCSILKGEGEIAEKLNKEKTNPATPNTSEPGTFIVSAPTAVPLSGISLPGVALTVQRFLTTEAAGTTSATVTTTSATAATNSLEPATTTTTTESTATTSLTTSSATTISNTASVSEPPTTTGSTPEAIPTTVTTTTAATPGASASTESRPLLLPYSVPPATSGASTAASNASDLSYPYLQALLDMGFPQDRCLEAISHTHSLEQATEFLLSNPLGSQSDGDMDFSEDDQWLQAVAMSLRETHQPSTSKPPTGETPLVIPPVVDEEPLSKEKLDEFTSTVLEGCLSQLDFQPQLVYKVCELLTTCVARNGNTWRETMLKTLMSQISEEASELTWIASQENSSETAEYLCSSETALKFAIRLHLVTLLFEEMKSGCAGELEEANLIEVLIELLCSAQEVLSANPHILLKLEEKKSKEAKDPKEVEADVSHSPKWLAPAMLLLDLYEKLSVATKRRAAVKKVTNHVWKWFDVSQVKWYGYTQSNNKIIDDAYWAGESSVRIVNSRRKYTIQFHTMLQVNEETGNRRPVMISISEKHIEELKKNISTTDLNLAPNDFKSCSSQGLAEMEGVKESEQPLELTKPKEQEGSEAASEKMECEESLPEEEKSGATKTESEDKTEKEVEKPVEEPPLIIKGFVDNHKERMIRACVGFMKLSIEPDTLNALMRLCLRITREWNHACLFASLGGVRTLLTLTETSSFWGFHSLAALLMRHILEEPNTLRHTMKKVVRFSAGSSSGVGAREFHSLLRVLAPAACRDSNLFTEIAQQCLRIDLNMALKRNLMTTSNEDSILMKSIGSKSVPMPSGSNPPSQSYAQLSGNENSEPQVLVHDLMEALATTDEDEATSTTTQGTSTTANGPSTCVSTPNEERNSGFPGIGSLGCVTRHLQLSRSSSANDMVVQDMDEQSPMDGEASRVLGTEAKATSTEDSSKKKKSLLSKSTLCKLLAEFIRSYAGVAKLVTDHQYASGINDKILEDCSALAYLLDQLVCGTGDTEMVNHVRVLIAALASCNHAPDAQATLVSEVKCCLSRVMCLPESPEKHTKIQSLVGLILTMMESCPTQINQPVNNTCYKQQMGMNNMIRIMIKKNLVTDLARIPHCLDLSSPNMATTINAALKPLETVLRIVNMPSFVSVPSSKKKSVPSDDQQQSGASMSNSEATRAQGEENVDDTENTEHDISGTGESLEPNSEANPSEDGPLVEGDEAGLEEILDRFLDDRTRSGRDSNRGSSNRDTITTTVAYVIDHGAPMDTDDTLHDSRMVTQSESQFLDETEDERNDDNDDESSSDDNDGDDDNEEEVEVEDDDDDDGDDDDDDDDDDDEDDEEEGSVFDQGYDELEEAFIRLPVERENDDVLLMPSYQQYINTIDTIIFGDRISLAPHAVSHDDNLFMTSTPNTTNTNATSAIPTHPLFQNPREVATPITRLANRPSRNRGVLRYQSVTPRSHSTTTTILQRLLGQTHRDVLQLTSNIREATQFIIGNQDVRIIQQNDDFIEPQELETNLMNSARTSNSGTIPGVPNALTRWMEEARVLESDSFHDAVTQVKPALMAVMEKYRDAEQAERDKKKKEQEAASKANSDSKRTDGTTAEGEGTSSVTSAAPGTTIAVSSSGIVPPSTAASSTTANGSTHNLIISILEQHFSSGSHTSASTASPTFTGLLTQLTPSSATGPSMSIQEPPTLPALPEAPLSTSTFPILEPLPINSSVATTMPTSTRNVTADFIPVVSSGFLSIAPTVSTSSVEIISSSPLMSAPLPTILSDAAMSPISPSIPLAPSIVYQLPTQSSSLSQPAIDEAMSVSPPEFSNISATPAIQTDETSHGQTDMGPEESNTTTSSSDQMPTEDALSESISQALSPMDQQMPSLEGQENSTTDEIEEGRPVQTLDPASTGDEQVESGSERPAASTSGSGSQNDFTAILGDIEIPEGVDPSFLAALPEDMRQEVISEQLRIQRVRERTAVESGTTQEPATQEVSEVSAEFLAALPPSIQEEVLAQQRIEQQRQQAARANPDDPTSFLLSLPQSLRQTILSDLEDSQFSALPTEVVQEAQTLRRQREDRSRHVHEHMFSRGGSSSISHILRNTARMGPRFMHSPSWSSWNVRPTTSNQQVAASSKIKGQQILDHEAMTCLLVLLFVDEPKLNTTRLHRVLKSLCQHPPTREWVIKTLLSIIERCGSQSLPYPNGRGLNESEAGMSGLSLEMSGKKGEKCFVGGPPATSTPTSSAHSWKLDAKSYQTPTWLSMSMDAALGCRASIFQIQRASFGGKKTPVPTSGSTVHIHPQAAPLVCRHAIDLLISLAKIFPSHFLPSPKELEDKLENKKSVSPTGNLSITTGAVSKGTKTSTASPVTPFSFGEQTDFWELLVKLDSISVSRKGKGLPRTHLPSTGSADQDIKSTCLETSPLGQLIQQLAHPVIKRSSLLTDRLLRLLALVSLGHSDTADIPVKQSMSSPESSKALEHLLGLSIQVLTSKSCSEEGLEDATALLLHLSHGPPPARDLVLKLLLQGAATLGQTVTIHINALLEELIAYNVSHPPAAHEDDIPHPSEKAKKGVLKDRFTCDQVVITSSKVKPPCEVQLPSMSALTSKTSSQAFFLRTLKVIIQLREAIRLARNRKNKSVSSTVRDPAVNALFVPAEQQQSEPSQRSQSSQEPAASVDQEQLTPPLPEDDQSTSNEGEEASIQVPQQMEVSTLNSEQEPSQPLPTPTVTVNSTEAAEVDNNVAVNETPSEAMEIDAEIVEQVIEELRSLSGELGLEDLWGTLSKCLVELGETPDTHAVLVLQPAVEAFFLVHASAAVPDKKAKPSTPQESREAQLAHLQHEIAPLSPLPASQLNDDGTVIRTDKDGSISEADSIASDAEKFLKFAETHRSVLNQILRQSTVHLADGPFSVLVDHTRLLDFDIKRKYFRTELERADDGIRREDLAVHVRREHVFEDSFRELHRRSPDEWKNRFYIVFEGEEGQDAGGLLREWYVIISREIFNPMYALFCISPGDRVTYMINPSSHCNSNHLSYFKFVGRVIAKAIYDNKLLECYFTRSFYKHILGKMVRVADMESEDYSFYQGLIYLLEHIVADLGYELTFSTEVQEFGVTEARDLKPNGRDIAVTEENKLEYIRLVCQEKMTGAIKKQLNSFLEGFYDIIPKRLISIFNEQELELLISGLPTIDIDDLKNNTEYHKYHPNSLQIQWFWRALRSFDQAERAKLVQFVTGTSKVPLQGFSALEGMNGTQKFQIHRDDRSTDRLPSAHTCFNQLDLPVYETYDKLRHYLLKAIQECSEGFGFA